jgi:hypothetical protein
MRQRPSGSPEENDASTPGAVPPNPVHGDKEFEHPRSIARDIHDTTRRRDSSRDDAPGQQPTTAPPPFRSPAQIDPSVPDRGRQGSFTMTLPAKDITTLPAKDITTDSMVEGHTKRRLQLRNPWACSAWTAIASLLGFAVLFVMVHSFLTRQLDTKGCEMCYMRPAYVPFPDFDTEHTRFASKYSLYLYREGGIDEDARVRIEELHNRNWG